jgi:hypothetical protein
MIVFAVGCYIGGCTQSNLLHRQGPPGSDVGRASDLMPEIHLDP